MAGWVSGPRGFESGSGLPVQGRGGNENAFFCFFFAFLAFFLRFPILAKMCGFFCFFPGDFGIFTGKIF